MERKRLTVALRALDFIAVVQGIADAMPRKYAKLSDQLTRSALGISLNIAEGSAEYARDEKLRLYRLARREAEEASNCLAVARRLRAVRPERTDKAQLLVNEITAMLTALILSPKVGRPAVESDAGLR